MPTTKPSKQRAAEKTEQTVRYVVITSEHESLLPLLAAARISSDEKYAIPQRAALARPDIVGATALLMRGKTDKGTPWVSLAIKPVTSNGEVVNALFFVVRWDGEETVALAKYFRGSTEEPNATVSVRCWVDSNREMHIADERPVVHFD